MSDSPDSRVGSSKGRISHFISGLFAAHQPEAKPSSPDLRLGSMGSPTSNVAAVQARKARQSERGAVVEASHARLQANPLYAPKPKPPVQQRNHVGVPLGAQYTNTSLTPRTRPEPVQATVENKVTAKSTNADGTGAKMPRARTAKKPPA